MLEWLRCDKAGERAPSHSMPSAAMLSIVWIESENLETARAIRRIKLKMIRSIQRLLVGKTRLLWNIDCLSKM
jgi:hypothetical protein